MADNKYAVDLENTPALTEVEAQRNTELGDIDTLYSNSLAEIDKVYKDAQSQYVIDANDGKTTAVEALMDAQNAATEQRISEINQEKEQAQKDYQKEQAGAYADWKKQSNPFGTNAEKLASNGLTQSGYAESVQAQMYSDYQSRIVSARETFKKAELQFSNAITNARLQNNATLAQIAMDAFQKQSEIALSALTEKQGLLQNWSNQKLAINTRFDNKYKDILDQINEENALLEESRQFDARLEAEKTEADAERTWKAEQALLERQHSDTQLDAKLKAEQTAAEEERTWKAEQALLERQHSDAQLDAKLKEEARQFDILNGQGVVFTDDEKGVVSLKRGEPEVKTYSNTETYLKNQGIPAQITKQLLNKTEWLQAKKKSPSEYDQKTYEAYLEEFSEYAIHNTPNVVKNTGKGGRGDLWGKSNISAMR